MSMESIGKRPDKAPPASKSALSRISNKYACHVPEFVNLSEIRIALHSVVIFAMARRSSMGRLRMVFSEAENSMAWFKTSSLLKRPPVLC